MLVDQHIIDLVSEYVFLRIHRWLLSVQLSWGQLEEGTRYDEFMFFRKHSQQLLPPILFSQTPRFCVFSHALLAHLCVEVSHDYCQILFWEFSQQRSNLRIKLFNLLLAVVRNRCTHLEDIYLCRPRIHLEQYEPFRDWYKVYYINYLLRYAPANHHSHTMPILVVRCSRVIHFVFVYITAADTWPHLADRR